MMRKKPSLFVLLMMTVGNIQAQDPTIDEREEHLSPALWRSIYDPAHSGYFEVDTIGFSELPPEVEYRGVVVEAIAWTDTSGIHVLVLTQTGGYPAPDTTMEGGQRADVHAYSFSRARGATSFHRDWRLTDHVSCPGLDMYIGFIRRGLTITDVNGDGRAEITLAYRAACRGGMDPSGLKVISYDGTVKCGLRGTSADCHQGHPEGGQHEVDQQAASRPDLLKHMEALWERVQCDEYKQYR